MITSKVMLGKLVLAVSVAVLLTATGQASIILPAQMAGAEFDLDELRSASTAGSTAATQPVVDTEEPGDSAYSYAIALLGSLNPLGSAPTSGSSTGTSSTWVGGGVFCAALSKLTIEKDTICRWLAIKYSLAIPDPPGSSLLRPPQLDCNSSVSA